MAELNLEFAKRRIAASIRELDKSDQYDICSLIKMYISTTNNSSISISERGTHINLDQLEDELIRQLDNMIMTKLQRIHLEQSQS